MSERHILFMPLARGFALLTAAAVREGRKIPGPSYADLDLQDAIERATRAHFARP